MELEDLFNLADELGEKYQTDEELTAYTAELERERQELKELFDPEEE